MAAELKRRNTWSPFPGPQTEALNSRADILFYGGAAGGGKGLDITTRLPTPAGFVTIGSVAVGDTVFDQAGQPCRVTAVSEVQHRRVFGIEFDDGVVLRADDVHRWLTFSAAEMAALTRRDPAWRAARRAARPSRALGRKSSAFSQAVAARTATARPALAGLPCGSVRNTLDILGSLKLRSGRSNHAVPMQAPLDLPEADLPIDPYVLGAWLGDGNSRHASITCFDGGILRQIESAGYRISPRAEKGSYGINGGLLGRLRDAGLLANKHVPRAYLRASIRQRVALLQGLMDTDGSATLAGACEFTTTLPALRDGVHELLASLGIKAPGFEGRSMLRGRDCGPKYRFKFTTAQPVFRLERKLRRQNRMPRRTAQFRYIKAVTEVASVPTRCIAVDSPSRLYLAGPAMVPTHNTDLLCGAAITRHDRSVIFRREYGELAGIMDRAAELLEGRGSYNGQRRRWSIADQNRRLEFGAVQFEEDVRKFQGRPHDLKAFDEITNFTESQFRFLMGWNRSAKPGQRSRVIATGNPPTTAEGDWVIRYWGPWLDKTHPFPAKPGELRWFATVNGKDLEVENGVPFTIEGEADLVQPKSRTFIKARVQDNPVYMASGYIATLQALPEPLRSQMLFGDFSAGQDDAEHQVIPTAWVLKAQARWTDKPPCPITTLGVDVARGGSDKTVLTPRHGFWFGTQRVYPGSSTPDGRAVAQLCLEATPSGARPTVQIDVSGVGSSPYDMARLLGLRAAAMDGSAASIAMDKSGKLGFVNSRAEWWWLLREALDPDSGDDLAIPPERELLADLTAPRWMLRTRGIQIEAKDDIIKRIGRSPDRGESLVYAFGRPTTGYDDSMSWV